MCYNLGLNMPPPLENTITSLSHKHGKLGGLVKREGAPICNPNSQSSPTLYKDHSTSRGTV